MNIKSFRHLEINGGQVIEQDCLRLFLPAMRPGYADAQIDDYGVTAVNQTRIKRQHLPWQPDVHLRLRARFSHPIGKLQGTAGFGFWNIPFADPTIKWPALPQATWFFYGSPPTNLPLSPSGKGQGWFAATIDAGTASALSMMPATPLVLFANQVAPIRKRLWPLVQCRLGISYTQLEHDITKWHSYELIWQTNGCRFIVDNKVVMDTKQRPRGPLGFVCWIDNQYMIVTPRGNIKWGVLQTKEAQWLQISALEIR